MAHTYQYLFTLPRIAIVTLMFSMLFSSCTEVVSVPYGISNLSIISPLPLQTEAVRGITYSFSAKHDDTESALEYRWNFDDDTVWYVQQTPKIQHSFAQDGWYTITLQVVNTNNRSFYQIAKLPVNVRSSVPTIPTKQIPSGSFMLGSMIASMEQPVRTVLIDRNLEVGIHETTQKEWETLMGTSPSYFHCDECPVENVSWYDVVDFCNRLSVRSGYNPAYVMYGDSVICDFRSNGYRLPTEAEWEYIARAGSNTEFYAGNVSNPYATCGGESFYSALVDSISWCCFNSESSTHPVGLKQPNAFGLYDVSGNVAEWVWDYFGADSYKQTSTTYPVNTAFNVRRMTRGGSFLSGVYELRSAHRLLGLDPRRGFHSVGFRIVRTR